MSGRTHHPPASSRMPAHRRAWRSLVAALVALMLAACGASAGETARTTSSARAPAVPGAATGSATHGAHAAAAASTVAPAATPCGPSAAQTRAGAAGFVARRIYAREVSSPEVARDRHQVEGYAPLLSALAGGSRSAVLAAATSLVFSHTHVVRLRVSRGSSLLADVGGPYILAPVGGKLRYQGRTVGRYLLSVQDDSGYAKLATRYIGYPLLMLQGSRRLPVEGTIAPGGTPIPNSGPVTWHGTSYQVFSFAAQAYPSGPLRISMLVSAPASSSVSCDAIRISELNRISQRIWRRFQLVGAPVSGFVSTMGSLVGALSYVRSPSGQLSGSTRPGPPKLPSQGSVTYHGVTYHVFSFAATVAGGPVRVYQLVHP